MSDPYPPSPDTPPEENPEAIRLTIPPRYYLLPGAAVILGTTLGLLRGSRRESLRFLAENVHRPPTTVRGWYLYNKTKNYRVMMGGLRQAGMDAGRLAAAAAVFVGVEEVAERMGGIVGEVGDVLAGIGTGAVFSMLCESCPCALVRVGADDAMGCRPATSAAGGADGCCGDDDGGACERAALEQGVAGGAEGGREGAGR